MEVLINSKNDVSHEIEIIVSNDELQPHFEKAYREEAKKINLPGFRPGKVPLQMIKKRFGKEIEYSVIEKLSNDFFRDALEERDIKPVGQPVLHDLDYNPGDALTIKVSYETEPDVVAKDYLGIQLERLSHEVTDEEVEDEMQRLLKSRRTLEEVDRADDENYLVTIDIQMLDDDGNPVPGQRNENMKVELDDEYTNRDLVAELLNMSVGEEKNVELTHIHGDHEHTEHAHVKVTSVERVTLPELNDEFVKDFTNGQAETVKDLRILLHDRIVEVWENRYKQQLDNDLVGEIVKRNAFEVPESIVENILDDYVKAVQEQQPNKKLPGDFKLEEYRKSRRQEAIFTAQWMYLRDNILEQEGIKLEDGDVEEKAAKDSEAMGIEKERLIEFYKSAPQYTQSMLVEKLIAHLYANAEIKDIDDNDLTRIGMEGVSYQEHGHGNEHEHGHEHGHEHEHGDEDENENEVVDDNEETK